MKALLQLLLPRTERMSGLGKEMRSGCEEARTALQLLGALRASALPECDRSRLGPQSGKLTSAASGRLGDQCADRQRLALVQEPQGPLAKPTDPAVQSGVMRMLWAQPVDSLSQRDAGKLSVTVARTAGLDHSPCIMLEGRNLYRKYTPASPANPAATQRYRRRAMLHALARGPARTAICPAGSVDQPTDDFAARAKILRANVLTLDGHVEKGIICNGNGDGYNTFRFSRRCGCSCARTSLLTTNRKPYDPTPINANTVRADGEL
jgi:prepilin-type processing-associated H-X9-DG protein